MKTVELIIDGEPKAKARPRKGKYGNIYTPKETQRYEELVKASYNVITGRYKFDGAVYVRIDAYLKIPQRTKLKHPTKKPDVDNIAKIIMDGLNKTAWDDDKQVVKLVVNKFWSNQPRCEVKIEEVVE